MAAAQRVAKMVARQKLSSDEASRFTAVLRDLADMKGLAEISKLRDDLDTLATTSASGVRSQQAQELMPAWLRLKAVEDQS